MTRKDERARWYARRESLRLVDAGTLHDVISLVIAHQLSHLSDDNNLALAIELLKGVREGPERVASLYETWADEILAARIEREP